MSPRFSPLPPWGRGNRTPFAYSSSGGALESGPELLTPGRRPPSAKMDAGPVRAAGEVTVGVAKDVFAEAATRHARSDAATLLVVDDNEASRRPFSWLLEQSGYRFTVAPAGVAALDVVARTPVDLVLLDVMMPGL